MTIFEIGIDRRFMYVCALVSVVPTEAAVNFTKLFQVHLKVPVARLEQVDNLVDGHLRARLGLATARRHQLFLADLANWLSSRRLGRRLGGVRQRAI